MIDTLFECNLLSLPQCMDRSRRNILHLEVREEAAQVQRLAGKAVINNPPAHLTDHLQVIIHARNDEIGQFYPHPGIMYGEDGIEDGLQMTSTDTLIDIVAE